MAKSDVRLEMIRDVLAKAKANIDGG